MTSDFLASTQYNDLTGSAAFDGHEGPGLMELADIVGLPDEYFPIGFQLHRLDPDEDGLLWLKMIAVKKAETGDTMTKALQVARDNKSLPTYLVDAKIDPRKFSAVFKRCMIVALVREFDPNELVKG